LRNNHIRDILLQETDVDAIVPLLVSSLGFETRYLLVWSKPELSMARANNSDNMNEAQAAKRKCCQTTVPTKKKRKGGPKVG